MNAVSFLSRHLPIMRVGSFTRNVFILVGGTALSQFIVVAASPILTRLYTPEDFGIQGVFVSLVGILTTIASLRYELAIPLPEEDDDAAALLYICLILIPGTTIITAVTACLLRHNLAIWTKTPTFVPHFWLLPVGMALTAIYQTFTYWAIRKGDFARLARTRMFQTTGCVAAQMTLFRYGPLGILLGFFLGCLIGTVYLTAVTLANVKAATNCQSFSSLTRIAHQHRLFPQLSTISSLINSSALLMPTIFLAALFGPLVAGQFALVQRVLAWPASLVGNAVAQVYLRESSILCHTDPSALHRLFLETSKRLALVAIPAVAALLVAAPWLFSRVFGPHWSEAGSYARLLAPMVATQLVARPLSQTLNILQCQSWILAWDICRLTFALTVFIAAPVFSLAPRDVVLGYASAMALSYLAFWALQFAAVLTQPTKTCGVPGTKAIS